MVLRTADSVVLLWEGRAMMLWELRVFVMTLVIVGASTGVATGETLKAGAATSNITPPLGQNIVGGFSPTPSTNVHDELFARCLVLEDGKTRLALVVCDLLGIHRLVSDEARKVIAERSKIS